MDVITGLVGLNGGQQEPNINFGQPAVFYDSHPDQQESYLGSYLNAFKAHLLIAWTGHVEKPLRPGVLRLVWWTTDSNKGFRDYELHQHALVKAQYDALCTLTAEVSRCLITGFSGQNPYVMVYGHNIWQEKFKKERRANNAKWLSPEERSRRRAEREAKLQDQEDAARGSGDAKEARPKESALLKSINQLIMSNEEAETQRLLGDVDQEDMA